MSTWIAAIAACVAVATLVANWPAGTIRDLIGRRAPKGVASRLVGAPTVVGATTCGFAVAAVRMGSGFQLPVDLPAGGPLVVVAAGALLVLVFARPIVIGA